MATSGLRLKDNVAIVTGGCSGIGKGCVEVFVENGGTVAVFDINDDVGNSLTFPGPGKTLYIHCDVTNEQEIQKSVERTIAEFGKIDCLVNNVGSSPGTVSIDDLTVDGFRQLLNLNVVSAFTLSKGAIGALSKALAIDESKYGVRVNTVCPGPINTPLLRGWLDSDEEKRKAVENWTQLGRVGEPREIGLACLFLATDATFTTGSNLMCTGGCEIGYGVKTDF